MATGTPVIAFGRGSVPEIIDHGVTGFVVDSVEEAAAAVPLARALDRAAIRRRFPWLRHVFADGGYAGDKLRDALAGMGRWTIEIIKRSDAAQGFQVLPRRWVVERTFGWMTRWRRLVRDYEKRIDVSQAMIMVAMGGNLIRRNAHP